MVNLFGLVQFWDITTGQEIRESIFLPEVPVFGLSINRDTKTLYTSNIFGILEWDLSSTITKPISFEGYYHGIGLIDTTLDQVPDILPSETFMKISSDGQYLLTQGTGNQILWDTSKRASVSVLNPPSVYSSTSAYICGDFIHDSPFVVLCGQDDTILIYDIEKNGIISSFHKKGVMDVNISTDSRFIVLSFIDGKFIVYDMSNPNPFITNRAKIASEGFLVGLAINHQGIWVSESDNLLVRF